MSDTTVRVATVRAESRTDSTDVATPTPRLTWKSVSQTNDWRQASAQVRLNGDETADVAGRESVLVAWPFAPLAPRASVSIEVRVTGEDGSSSEWSEPHVITAAFLADGEWTAPMVGLDAPGTPALVRTGFEVRGEVAHATLYATAHGAYQAWINGEEVDDQVLKPGWTSYQWRLVHETTDVTDLLVPGANAIGLSVAGAWYTERFGFQGLAEPFYGTTPAVAAQLVIDYADGSSQTVTTDGTWRATGDGPVTASGIYAGESYDATREIDGWSTADFDDSAWTTVTLEDGSYPTPTARSTPAVRPIEEVAVTEVITTPSGKTVVDFGQNLVGRLRITVRGERGTVITMRHAEVLEHGELGIRPLRYAKATDTYTLTGDGEETWEPRFTFHGFRYAELEGWPGEFDPTAVTAVVLHSDMARTGWFDSSHELVNRLHENVVWGMKGNFLYVPTDCPQRDERLGWTGDIQVFSPTASFLFDVDAFLTGWLEDVALEQREADGVVPFVVPMVLGDRIPAAAWGDAATVVPSVLYERYADEGVLRTQFPSMVSWTDALLRLAGDRNLWEDHFQFGDWLDPDASPDFPADAKTDPDIVASAYLFRSADLTARAAALLGETAAAEKYGVIAEKVREAFLAEYVSPSGRMISDAQTGYAVAIMFDIARDPAQRQAMGDRLATLTRSNGYRIGTGFVGTPLMTDALTVTGHLDAATRLLTQTENPSWLYPVTMGATTIWERWDSMLEDGSINPGEMTSFNHYALGAVADWLHRGVAGLAPAEPGYAVIAIEPHPLDGFDFAKAAHETPYGPASVGWTRTGGSIVVEAVIPANTTARVTLPGSTESFAVGSGTYSWTVDAVDAAALADDLSLDSSLATIIDDPEAYAAVGAAIGESHPERAESFRKHTAWTPGRQLTEAFIDLGPDVRARATAALDAINARRSSSSVG